MIDFLYNLHNFFGIPEMIIGQMDFIPVPIKEAIITVITFVPWLYFLYYALELLERFFLKNLGKFLNLIKNLGPLFATTISIIPECGYSVLASTLYARRMITRGTLLAFYIACSDEALPLLFINPAKSMAIIPLILIKITIGVFVSFIVDLADLKENQTTVSNQMNTNVNIQGCCAHTMTTEQNPPYWWVHPITHTFNMFIFCLIWLIVINCAIAHFGSAQNLAQILMINTPIQFIVCAFLGVIPNSIISIFFALAYVKGIIGFPALTAGLISSAGIALSTLKKHSEDKLEYNRIRLIMVIIAILTGFIVYFDKSLLQFFNGITG